MRVRACLGVFRVSTRVPRNLRTKAPDKTFFPDTIAERFFHYPTARMKHFPKDRYFVGEEALLEGQKRKLAMKYHPDR